jgi:transcription-repair coupling factor (superfamily II helicase)
MSLVYPAESKSIPSDFRKNYWGSLFGPSEALALLEFAESNEGFVLYIASDIKHYDKINKSLAFFNKSIEILSFASWEVLAFDHFSPHPDIVSSRLSTLAKLSSLESGIIVTTIEALSQRICPRGFIDKYSLSLKNNQNLEIDSFTENLIRIGYRRVTTVMEQGEFSLKGALIDMYPMGAKNPYRIDLFDNEIESIRSFDPSSQRSIELIEEIQLLPAREFASDKSSIDIFKKNYLSEFGNTDGFIYTEVSEGRYPGGIEFYLPLFFETTETLFDFIPDNSVIAYQKGISESIDLQTAELLERFNYCQNSLERLPLAVNKVFLNSHDFFAALKKKKQVQIQTSKTLKDGGFRL